MSTQDKLNELVGHIQDIQTQCLSDNDMRTLGVLEAILMLLEKLTEVD